MSKSHRLRLCFYGTLSGAALFASAASAQTLPATQVTCPASGPMVTSPPSTTFSSWFTGGTPGTLNAAVSPADSLNFSNNTSNANTDFYRWSYRMFLWLTSPTPATYGGTGLVMSSPEFYNLTPNSAGDFVMTQNPTNPFLRFGPIKAVQMAKAKPPAPLHLGLRIANLGPHGLPLVHDTAGNFMEVLPAKLAKDGKPLVLDTAGKEVELSKIVVDAQGQVKFQAKTGAAIATPKLQPLAQPLRAIGLDAPALRTLAEPKFVFQVNPSIINGNKIIPGPIFILPSGAVIPTVVGDSDGNVQMTQKGSLIYYGIAVNDVYAYYVTQINPTVTNNTTALFPTTQANLTSVQTFATSKGHTLLDPNSLAMEIKTAWVDASTLPNANEYITMRAVVPTYNKSNKVLWAQNGTTTITAALIGIHVVGSVAGHPEMVWSTFEHVGNTPNVSYVFDNPSGTQATQPADPVNSTTKWLFCGATSPPSNGQTAQFTPNAKATFTTPPGVQAVNSTTTVQGTSVLRLAPWGAPDNKTPNPLISSVAASNTQIISLNNDIHSQMNTADLRNQYFFLGATWTENGEPPGTNFGSSSGGANVVGTSHLANSTLETFTQSQVFVSGIAPGPGCLSCHVSNSNSVSTVNVSHIFTITKALP
jgi:hypothetical protein